MCPGPRRGGRVAGCRRERRSAPATHARRQWCDSALGPFRTWRCGRASRAAARGRSGDCSWASSAAVSSRSARELPRRRRRRSTICDSRSCISATRGSSGPRRRGLRSESAAACWTDSRRGGGCVERRRGDVGRRLRGERRRRGLLVLRLLHVGRRTGDDLDVVAGAGGCASRRGHAGRCRRQRLPGGVGRCGEHRRGEATARLSGARRRRPTSIASSAGSAASHARRRRRGDRLSG